MNFFKPMNPTQAASHLEQYFSVIQAKQPDKPLQIKIISDELGLDFTYPPDSSSQPYHIASIGKVFTAALIYTLVEKGILSPRDGISSYFTPADLDRLFVFKNVDHAPKVTLEHLLGHTSGIADYFEGKTTSGKSFQDGIIANPDFHWTPQKLIDFTRENQSAVGSPGQVFNYSDTGYILLGLIIENVTGKSFAENLEDVFFRPLEMNDSYLMFYSEPVNIPKKNLAKIWFQWRGGQQV